MYSILTKLQLITIVCSEILWFVHKNCFIIMDFPLYFFFVCSSFQIEASRPKTKTKRKRYLSPTQEVRHVRHSFPFHFGNKYYSIQNFASPIQYLNILTQKLPVTERGLVLVFRPDIAIIHMLYQLHRLLYKL